MKKLNRSFSPATRPADLGARPATIDNRLSSINRHRRAFSLIEILVVMGIIVLLVALALPAFNFISGSRSVEAASNRLSAVFGVARTQAVGVQQTQGVAIYHDPDTDKAVAVLVELRTLPFADYAAGSTGATPVTVPYVYGQYVTFSFKSYVCLEAYGDTGAPGTKPNFAGSTYWREMTSATAAVAAFPSGTPVVEVRPGGDYSVLPTGIDVRAVGNTFSYVNATAPYYRYFSPAVFLFDANGQLVSTRFAVLNEGILGNKFDSAKAVPAPPSTTPPTPTQAFSGIGMVAYDTKQFANATVGMTLAATEDWLDQNATPSMINRFNGTLVKGE